MRYIKVSGDQFADKLEKIWAQRSQELINNYNKKNGRKTILREYEKRGIVFNSPYYSTFRRSDI